MLPTLTRVTRTSCFRRRLVQGRSWASVACDAARKDAASTANHTAGQAFEKVVDARLKFGPDPRHKPSITGLDIEKRLHFSSVVEAAIDRSPFLQRVGHIKRQGTREARRQREDQLDRPVDSLAAALLLESEAEASRSPPFRPESEPERDSDVEVNDTDSQYYMGRYERLRELKNEVAQELSDEWDLGRADAAVPASQVPCGGCGAALHCRDANLPGFLPADLFVGLNKKELRARICQRCRFLQEHQVALDVRVNADDYPHLLKSVIENQTALVLVVVDLLDFPCSIWPGLADILGTKRPVYVVGNKVDLLPKDSAGYLEEARRSLAAGVAASAGLGAANVRHVALVSAATGYGVEELITRIQQDWGLRGDVYLMGCTNAGKSSLFNRLLGSDFCKTQAADLMRRATVSVWPGTTLHLLKFPMLRPSAIRLWQRVQRLRQQQPRLAAERQRRAEQLRQTHHPKYATLTGDVGRTFAVDVEPSADAFAVRADRVPDDPVGYFNPEADLYGNSKWCHDTPGTFSPDQMFDLLTMEELVLAAPDRLIRPRTVLMRPGWTFFLAGLARIDYVDGPHPIMLTAFASRHLPLTLCDTSDAGAVYERLLGTRLLAVPCGADADADASATGGRLARWPGLSEAAGGPVAWRGAGWRRSAVDVVLSSAGWAALTGADGVEYRLAAWTPHGRGVHTRRLPLSAGAVALRGARLPYSPAFASNRLFVK